MPERSLAQGAKYFLNSGLPELPRHLPEAAEPGHLPQIAERHIAHPIPFAAEGKYRVRAGLDAAADHAREVDAEERQRGIGDRVDQVAHQMMGTRHEFVIFAAERNDLHARLDAALARDPVRLQA